MPFDCWYVWMVSICMRGSAVSAGTAWCSVGVMVRTQVGVAGMSYETTKGPGIE